MNCAAEHLDDSLDPDMVWLQLYNIENISNVYHDGYYELEDIPECER